MKYTYILISLFLFACSSPSEQSEGSDEGTAAETQDTSAQTEQSTNDPNTFHIVASGDRMDQIKYDRKLLVVPAETEITIVLENKSSDPAMSHNFVIITPGTANDVGQEGMKFSDVGYVNPNSLNVIAHSPLSAPGETVQFTFTTPEAGEYEFICTYPGHWGFMKGKFIVE